MSSDHSASDSFTLLTARDVHDLTDATRALNRSIVQLADLMRKLTEPMTKLVRKFDDDARADAKADAKADRAEAKSKQK